MAEEKNDREVVAEKAKDFGEVTMKLSLDVSEALTGLEAVQREAREATKALRELEAEQNSLNQPITVAPLSVGDITSALGVGSIKTNCSFMVHPNTGGDSE